MTHINAVYTAPARNNGQIVEIAYSRPVGRREYRRRSDRSPSGTVTYAWRGANSTGAWNAI